MTDEGFTVETGNPPTNPPPPPPQCGLCGDGIVVAGVVYPIQSAWGNSVTGGENPFALIPSPSMTQKIRIVSMLIGWTVNTRRGVDLIDSSGNSIFSLTNPELTFSQFRGGGDGTNYNTVLPLNPLGWATAQPGENIRGRISIPNPVDSPIVYVQYIVIPA